MKRVTCVIGLAMLLLAGSTLPAEAAGGGGGFHGGGSMSGRGFHGGGGRLHGGTRVFIGGGVGFGWWGCPGWWGPAYPYPYPYYADPPVVVQQSPTEYLQQAPAPPAAPQYWYYCQDARAYYPYVKECPAGWLQVVPQPASPGP